jgi:hypothetical protein
MKKYSDELTLDFKSYDQLSYEDNDSLVGIFLDDKPMGLCEVFTDRENEKREYVCINYEMIYLDTLKQIN